MKYSIRGVSFYSECITDRKSFFDVVELPPVGLQFKYIWGKVGEENKGLPSNLKMPVLFVGHGSPMNAIDNNDYSRALTELGLKLPIPKAILVISAHWVTKGTFVTSMKNPKTIHDFYGFPQALFDVQYPAPGSPEVAELITATPFQPKIQGDSDSWGLDHGTWSVLRHLYPEANIPVLQLSLDLTQPLEYHVNLGQQLTRLRDQGILLVGSGNLVHNLGLIRWKTDAAPFDWAIEFDEWVKEKLLARDFDSVLNNFNKSKAGQLSVPTLEHYLPLHYVLGATLPEDDLRFEFEGIQHGSISMRSFSLGFR